MKTCRYRVRFKTSWAEGDELDIESIDDDKSSSKSDSNSSSSSENSDSDFFWVDVEFKKIGKRFQVHQLELDIGGYWSKKLKQFSDYDHALAYCAVQFKHVNDCDPFVMTDMTESGKIKGHRPEIKWTKTADIPSQRYKDRADDEMSFLIIINKDRIEALSMNYSSVWPKGAYNKISKAEESTRK